MATLIELDLGEGRTVLVETDDEVSVPRSAAGTMGYQPSRRDSALRADLGRVQRTLQGFVDGAVGALRDVDADVERVTLEFGLGLGGEAGIPFVTKGKAEGALRVTVQCNLSRRQQRVALEPEA